jgi:hypothetical protein
MADNRHNNRRFYVEVQGGTLNGKRVEIGEDEVIIGRSPTCSVVLNDPAVSRRHARLYADEGACFIEDMESRNGLLVNGRETSVQSLKDGDIIRLGNCALTFHCVGRAQAPPPSDGPDVAGELSDQAEQLETMGMSEALGRAAVREPLHPFAVAGLVFVGFACWFWAFGLGAVVLGALSLREIRMRGEHRGMPLALAAIIGGLLAGGMNACWRSGGFHVGGGRDPEMVQCERNLRRLNEALEKYRADRGRYPEKLEDLLPDYVLHVSMVRCPGAESEQAGAGYAFPAAGKEAVPEGDVLLCDKDATNHRGRGGHVLRVGGRIEWLTPDRLHFLSVELEGKRR